MMRLFVAVRPPDEVRDALRDAMGGVAAARWQDDDQLHLTLRFVGEVDRHAANDIAAALAEVRHPAITARLGEFGFFATRGRPNALWIGVEPAAALTTLHHKVDHALVRAGVAPDTRAFVPHITLARLGRDAGQIGGFLAQPAPAANFAATALTLYESRLTRAAAVYHPLATFVFGAQS
jgi:2'-5' RNA ligase